MWEGRGKDRREKSKYTEWECGDRSWDNLLIWFSSRSGKQLTAGWTCFLITPCLMSTSLCWVHAGGCPLLLPRGAEPSWWYPVLLWAAGVTAALHPAVAASPGLPSLWKPGWGHTSPSPAALLKKGKGNWFSPLDSGVPLETLAQGRAHPRDPREREGGAGQVRALDQAAWRWQGLACTPSHRISGKSCPCLLL